MIPTTHHRGLDLAVRRVYGRHFARGAAFWPLDDQVDATAIRELSNRFPGTKSATGVTLGATGPLVCNEIARAAAFDGAAGEIKFGNIMPQGAFTFSCWLNAQTKTNNYICNFRNGWSTPAIYVYSTQSRIMVQLGVSNFRYFGTVGAYDGAWHHLAVTVTGNGQNDIDNTVLYWDAVPVSVVNTVKTGAQDPRLQFGLSSRADISPYKGSLSQVLLAPYACTPTEVLELAAMRPPQG